MADVAYDFDTDVQKKFLSLLVFDQNWASVQGVEILHPEFFENRILKNLCAWILKYQKQYHKPATKTVLENEAMEYTRSQKQGTDEYYLYTDVIDDIFTLTPGETLEYYKDKAVKFAQKASFFNALLNAKDLFERSDNYNAALDMFKEALNIGGTADLGMDLEDVKFDFLDIIGQTYSSENMFKTLIPGWDEALGGGFVKDNIHIIGAAPGGGKSKTMAFLCKQALKQRKKVIFISLELTEAETMANIINSITGMNLRDLLKPENRQRYTDLITQFSQIYGPNLKVKFFKPATVTTNEIQNYIMRVSNYSEQQTGNAFQPDVIFVDYLDKLLPTQKIKGNTYEDIGGVADDLKNLAITYSCPLITASQLGRFVWDLKDDQVISMASVSESARKVHLAHSITTLNANPAEKDLGLVRLYRAKSRSGSPGKVIYCKNDLGRCSMVESEAWNPKDVYQTTSNVATNIKTGESK